MKRPWISAWSAGGAILIVLCAGCSDSTGSAPGVPASRSAQSVGGARAAQSNPLPATATTAPTPPAVAAVAADSVVATIGIVTHFDYTDTPYRYLSSTSPAPNGDSVVSSLATLGVRHLRDGAGGMGTNAAICPAFKQAYAHGADVEIVMLNSDTASTFSTASSCLGSALRAFEGPNELDGNDDPNYATDDVAAMARLSAARGSSFPSGIPLFAPSMEIGCASYEAEANVSSDKIASLIDDNNAHIYFGGYPPENDGTGSVQCGIGPYGSESTSVRSAIIPAPAKQFVVTETGYPDNCCSFSDSGYVSPAVKTKYTLRTLLVHFHAGAKLIYFYELISESQSYGLTDQYLNPKPAYTALENFIRIMKDPNGTKTGTLHYRLSSNLSSAAQLLFEKQDGTFWLVVWQPVQSWNPTSHTSITVSPIAGSVTFGAQPAALKTYVFNPASGAVTTTSLPAGTVANISVTDTPQILQIGSPATTPVLATPQPAVY